MTKGSANSSFDCSPLQALATMSMHRLACLRLRDRGRLEQRMMRSILLMLKCDFKILFQRIRGVVSNAMVIGAVSFELI